MTLIKEIAESQAIGQDKARAFKVVLMTEVDSMTKDAQQALRRTMEKYQANCRLVLFCNNPCKVQQPFLLLPRVVFLLASTGLTATCAHDAYSGNALKGQYLTFDPGNRTSAVEVSWHPRTGSFSCRGEIVCLSECERTKAKTVKSVKTTLTCWLTDLLHTQSNLQKGGHEGTA